MHLFKSIFILLITLLFLSGCGSSPSIIKSHITVSEDVNPDITGRASPVVIRVYELKSLGNFDSADFYSLYENYETALRTDLTGTEQFLLGPGETQSYKQTTSDETSFIGVIAAFRELDKAVWKDSISVVPKKNSEVTISLEKLSVKITKK